MPDKVDVLIIGAGAYGAALAWSLAETKMHIVCLEQGDWMNPAEYPATRRDAEARNGDSFAINPNRRAGSADYPINEDTSPIKVANFNAVGGGTVLYGAHTPRFHPSDFRVRTLDGVADDWPIDDATLAPFYDLNDRMMGTSGLACDPAYPPKPQVMPPLPMGGSVMPRAVCSGARAVNSSDHAISIMPIRCGRGGGSDGVDGCRNVLVMTGSAAEEVA
jgi:choline dehydrogenase-like flavoprotein